MTLSLFDITDLKGALREGKTLLTPNRRMQAKILASYSQEMAAAGITAFNKPNVMTLEVFISNLFESMLYADFESAPSPEVLTDDQEVAVWEKIIKHSPQAAGLMQPSEAAKLAKTAYKTLVLWNETTDQSEFNDFTQTKAYVSWDNEFRTYLANMQVMTKADRATAIIDALEAGTLTPLKDITLVGFDDIPPLHFKLLKAACTSLNTVPLRDTQSEIRSIAALDENDEMRLAAEWALTILRQDKNAVIGIIDPALGTRRDDVERTFADVMDAQYIMPDVNAYALPFNISAGKPLVGMPIAARAIDIWKLNRNEISYDLAITLLNSPLLGGYKTEYKLRQKLASKIAKLGKTTLTTEELITLAQQVSCSDFAERLINMTAMAPENASLNPSAWAVILGNQLEAMGWPGDKSLVSYEYQQATAVHEILHQIAPYDSLLEQVRSTEVISIAIRLMTKTPFQPETKDSPIQILGALEGAGLTFSHLWVMGMRDDAWPAAPEPNPFIPVNVQRDKLMPNSSPERELEFAKRLTARYSVSAKHVMFSFPSFVDDREVRLSSLLDNSNPIDRNEFAKEIKIPPSIVRQVAQSKAMAAYSDNQGKPFNTDNIADGGVAILKNQAQCPFRAYSTNRLNIKTDETPVKGLTDKERGINSHAMLEFFWAAIKDQHTLINMDANLINNAAEQASMDAVKQRASVRPDIYTPNVQLLEQERLADLMHRVIAIELQRSPFKVIATEEESVINVNGLQMRLRSDRRDAPVDHAGNELNSSILIDYKSNASDVSSWGSDRPTEPQLPITAVTQETPVSAVAFLGLNKDKLGFKGVQDDYGVLPATVTPDKIKFCEAEIMDEVIDYWKGVIHKLADDFIDGGAEVNPAKGNQSCLHCQLKSVCRIKLMDVA